MIVLCKEEQTTWELKKFYTTSKFVCFALNKQHLISWFVREHIVVTVISILRQLITLKLGLKVVNLHFAVN